MDVVLADPSVQFHPRNELRRYANRSLHLAKVAVFQMLFDLGAGL